MPYKNIARLIPTIQAANLVKENLKAIDTKKEKGGTKKIVDLGMKNIVGLSLIKLNADLIESI
jgi:hypothetical protein